MTPITARAAGHIGQTGMRSCRSTCRGAPKFRPCISETRTIIVDVVTRAAGTLHMLVMNFVQRTMN
jgi:hypothetical protein